MGGTNLKKNQEKKNFKTPKKPNKINKILQDKNKFSKRYIIFFKRNIKPEFLKITEKYSKIGKIKKRKRKKTKNLSVRLPRS